MIGHPWKGNVICARIPTGPTHHVIVLNMVFDILTRCCEIPHFTSLRHATRPLSKTLLMLLERVCEAWDDNHRAHRMVLCGPSIRIHNVIQPGHVAMRLGTN